MSGEHSLAPMVIEPAETTACQCPQGCGCGNDADLVYGEIAICGCCLADCPDVHGPDAEARHAGYQVRLVPWRGGLELHVDEVGMTQCAERAEAETTVRDFLESLEHEDARTANVTLWNR